jgi:hypothetical protein
MSKKRKTRKQKEAASLRHTQEIQHVHVHAEAPTYSITNIKPESNKVIIPAPQRKEDTTVEEKDAAYLRHDIFAITAASGIVIAFDVLLLVLLSTGLLHLNFLGY